MNPSQITLNVPDEMAQDVAAWKDGQNYDLTVTQTAPGQLTLVSSKPSEPDADDESDDDSDNAPDTSNMPSKNPAIAIVMAKSAKGK